jgi:hypothetical protein
MVRHSLLRPVLDEITSSPSLVSIDDLMQRNGIPLSSNWCACMRSKPDLPEFIGECLKYSFGI